MSGAVTETDAIVIGAGPVGLFAVFELGMVRLRCHVVDSLEAIGGQLVALYPTKPIYDIPGYPKILAAGLIEQLEAQAAPFNPVYRLGVSVSTLSRKGDRWAVGLSDGATLVAPVVVIAAGAGAFGPNRPPLEGLEAYEGKSVFYLVKRQEDFAGKRVVIAGRRRLRGGLGDPTGWSSGQGDGGASPRQVSLRARLRSPDAGAGQGRQDRDGGPLSA